MKVAAVLRNLREFGQNAAHNNRYMYLLYLQKQAKLFLKAQSFLHLALFSNVFLPDQLVLALWSIFRLSLCTSTSDLLLHSMIVDIDAIVVQQRLNDRLFLSQFSLEGCE